MKQLNTHNIELPDGRFITVEGGDAATVASLLSKDISNSRLVTQQPSAAAVHNGVIEPLVAPTLNFAKPSEAAPARAYAGEIEPLVAPVMNFSKPERKARPVAATAAIEPLRATPPLFPAQ